jgi:Phage DNA packaging protein, Nu1 subunit of terminase
MDGLKQADGKFIISTKELCELLDISDRTLTDWKRQGLTQHSRGWWGLKHVLKWRGQIYNGDSEVSKSVNLQQKKLEAEVAFKEAQSELTRLKTDIANGKYIEKELVEAELSRFFIIFKKSAMAIPRRLANEVSSYVDPIEARRIEKNLSEIVNDALEQMSVDGVYHAKGKTKTN